MKTLYMMILASVSLFAQAAPPWQVEAQRSLFMYPDLFVYSRIDSNIEIMQEPSHAPDPAKNFTWKDAKISLDTPTKALFVNHKLMAYIEKMDTLWALWGKDGHIIDKYDDLETAQKDAEEQFVPKVDPSVVKQETGVSGSAVSSNDGTSCTVWVIIPDVEHVYCGDHELTEAEIKALPDDTTVKAYTPDDPGIPKHTEPGNVFHKVDPQSGPKTIPIGIKL